MFSWNADLHSMRTLIKDMSSLIIIMRSYVPGAAATNRIMAMIKALSQECIQIKVIFLLPNRHFDKFENNIPNVTFEYYWDSCYINNKYFKYLSYTYYVYKLYHKLKKGDIVFGYGIHDILSFLMHKKKVHFYMEQTEHPLVTVLGSPWHYASIKEHLSSFRKLDGLFVISRALRDYYIENGVDSNKIKIINMTVDPERFNGLEKQKNKEHYIAYCGTVSNNKDGVDELIKSFSIVVKSYPQMKLFIIGGNPSITEGNENLLLINRLNLQDNVVLTGKVSPNDIPQLLKNADVLVLDRPNSLQAKCGFPTKLGEYLLTENPVVVTNVGDIPLFLKNGESALIAEDRNPNDFAEKILWCLRNPDKANEIGKNGAKVALAFFNSFIESRKIKEYIFG